MKRQFCFTLVEVSLIIIGILLLASLTLSYTVGFSRKSVNNTMSYNLSKFDDIMGNELAESNMLPPLEANFSTPEIDESAGFRIDSKALRSLELTVPQITQSALKEYYYGEVFDAKSPDLDDEFNIAEINDDELFRKHFGVGSDEGPATYTNQHLVVFTLNYKTDINGKLATAPTVSSDLFTSKFPYILLRISSKNDVEFDNFKGNSPGETKKIRIDYIGSFWVTNQGNVITPLTIEADKK